MSGPPGSFVLNHLLPPPSSCFPFSITNSFLFCSPISLVYVLLKQGQPFLTSHFNAHMWQRLLLSIWGPPPRLPSIVLNFMSIFYFVKFQQLDIFFSVKDLYLYACVNICPCVKMSAEDRRGCCILNSWSYRLLWATLWVVGTDRRSWDRAANSLIHQAILIAPDFIVNTVLKSWHSLSFPSIFISITENLPLNSWYLQKKKKRKENMKWSHFFCLKYTLQSFL